MDRGKQNTDSNSEEGPSEPKKAKVVLGVGRPFAKRISQYKIKEVELEDKEL
jgi:hypothetical protein